MTDVIVYEQEWHDGRRSYHRHPSDILEFARNQNPVPVRWGKHREVRVQEPTKVNQIHSSGLGMWAR